MRPNDAWDFIKGILDDQVDLGYLSEDDQFWFEQAVQTLNNLVKGMSEQ